MYYLRTHFKLFTVLHVLTLRQCVGDDNLLKVRLINSSQCGPWQDSVRTDSVHLSRTCFVQSEEKQHRGGSVNGRLLFSLTFQQHDRTCRTCRPCRQPRWPLCSWRHRREPWRQPSDETIMPLKEQFQFQTHSLHSLSSSLCESMQSRHSVYLLLTWLCQNTNNLLLNAIIDQCVTIVVFYATHRLAPPASGDTMIELRHSGIFSLIHFNTAGSAYKLSTGMSKNP